MINTTDEAVLISSNFSMKLLSESLYYNATALDSLDHRYVRVLYNIIAKDRANNTAISPVQIVYLGDVFAPIILNIAGYQIF